ncbi:MAG TPA: beta galactosidase jelly roll domain-containing protein, partial [Candidatus Sulfopaludibacter sp.]|nr:beta galactosidase jelly roll domain-containing protein [Candidatus Sulfopaludibacter sp.]
MRRELSCSRSATFAMRGIATLLVLAAVVSAGDRTPLRQGWSIQSSADVADGGAMLSTAAYTPRNWYGATLPSTVLSALNARVYLDPYVGMNLRSIAGTTYPIGFNFSNAPMPPDSPFRHSWWYRTQFDLPASDRGKTVWLGFDGINFRMNVWLNGRQVASADHAAGAWRLFEFDITEMAKPGERNTLAIEVFPPQPHDLAITFVDWNPQPPDKDMGIWRDVYLSTTGPVALRYPAVTTTLNLPRTDEAQLAVRAELRNASGREVVGTLRGKIESQTFSQTVALKPHEMRVVRMAPLKVANPRLWWPAQTGPQNLYPLELAFDTGGQV